jgi:DNA-binding NarL/FixJ family response regulator
MGSPTIDDGWAALRDGDSPTARHVFARVLAEVESGDALEGMGQALYLECNYTASIDHYEQAYAAYRKEGQTLGAARAARMLAWVCGNVLGDWAVQSGWLARARTILEEAGDGRPEYGWLLIIKSYTERDTSMREELLREAITIGRRFDDPDIEFEALGWLGGLLMLTDRIEQGLVLMDEALAAACAGETTDIETVDSMFCGFFWACEVLNDVSRADQWMRTAADSMKRRNVVAAFCRAHYGGILTAAGRWPEAEIQLVQAVRHFDHGMSGRRAAAIIRLADLRVRQGRLEEAEQLLKGLEQHPDAVRANAALHFARGDIALARDLLERATEGSDDHAPPIGIATPVGQLLAQLVEVCIEDGSLDDAERAADRLGRIAEWQQGTYLRAMVALARGRVIIASGQGDARAWLHDAREGFALAQLPMELAQSRLEMARAQAKWSPEVAIAEAKAALEDFEKLQAARHADAAAALLRSLGAPIRTGPKGFGALTKREAEVLQLVGAGLSNAEIGDRLYISRKTVEHHVGHLLSKLALRNRAEAAAYAIRQETSR